MSKKKLIPKHLNAGLPLIYLQPINPDVIKKTLERLQYLSQHSDEEKAKKELEEKNKREKRDRLFTALGEGATMARDARVGNVWSQQVRDLYAQGKTEEALELAKKYAKGELAGLSMIGGMASGSLLGDLAVTGVTTTAETALDGGKNLGKNLLKNAAFDVIGKGFEVVPRFYKWYKNSANDVLKINSFEEAFDSALDFYQRNVNSNAKKSDYLIHQTKKDMDDTLGTYSEFNKIITIPSKDSPSFMSHFTNKNALIHEMRHLDDALIHPAYDENWGSFTMDDDRIGQFYGRIQLTDDEYDILNKAYKLEDVAELPTLNIDFKGNLENGYIKEFGKIPTVEELNSYINNLPYPILWLGRAMSSYPSFKSNILTLIRPNVVKRALTTVK